MSIKINENDPNDQLKKFDIFDDFECRLKKRMTLINVIDQDFFDKERLDSLKNVNNIKILYILKDNGQKSINDIIHSKATNNIINQNNSL